MTHFDPEDGGSMFLPITGLQDNAESKLRSPHSESLTRINESRSDWEEREMHTKFCYENIKGNMKGYY
jgi:hypothetical protein